MAGAPKQPAHADQMVVKRGRLSPPGAARNADPRKRGPARARYSQASARGARGPATGAAGLHWPRHRHIGRRSVGT